MTLYRKRAHIHIAHAHGAHTIYWFSYSHLSVQNSHYTVLPLQPSQSTWKRQVRYVDLQQSRITRSQKGTSRTTCLLLWLHFCSACRPALAAHAVPDHILNTDWSPAPMRDVDFHTPQPPRSAFSHTAGRPPLPHARNRSFLLRIWEMTLTPRPIAGARPL